MKLDFDTWQALIQLHADYAVAVDSGDWALWPTFFTEGGLYKLQPRDHERGFPLSTLAFDGHGAMRDRVYGIQQNAVSRPLLPAPRRRRAGAARRGRRRHSLREQLRGVPNQAQRPVLDRVQRRPLHQPRGVHAPLA